MVSLIGFHKLLISAAILFCAGFAVWQGVRWRDGGAMGDLVLALVFAAFALAFGYYLARLNRFLGGPDGGSPGGRLRP